MQIRRRRVGSFPSLLLGKTLCQRGDQKTGGRGGVWVYQPSSPCYTSSDSHSAIQKQSMYPCSAKVLAARRLDRIGAGLRSDHGWDLRTYPQDTVGPWKGRALSVHPRDPTACQTHYYTCPVHSRGHTRMKWDYMWIISNYLQHGIKAIFERHNRKGACVFYKNKYHHHGNKMLSHAMLDMQTAMSFWCLFLKLTHTF